MLLPLLGLKGLLIAGAVLDMAIGVVLLRRGVRPGRRRRPRLWLAAAAPRRVVVLVVGGRAVRWTAALLIERRVPPGADAGARRAGDRRSTATGAPPRSPCAAAGPTTGSYLATNGKPDASLGPEWRRAAIRRPRGTRSASDAATQTLLPLVTLAHAPSARSAAIIG